jgi:hypothetical protein
MEKSVKLFYTPPREESFNELKEACIKFWNTFDDEFGYATEKIDRIKDLPNDGPNFVMMVQMIHPVAREVISKLLSLEARNEISMRMYGWEKENEFDFFNIWNIDNNVIE